MAVTRTFILDEDTDQRLDEMATKTERTKSAMLRWLINSEWYRFFDPEKAAAEAPTPTEQQAQAA